MNNSIYVPLIVMVLLMIRASDLIKETKVTIQRSLILAAIFIMLFVESVYLTSNMIVSIITFIVGAFIFTAVFLTINKNMYYQKNLEVYRKKNYSLIIILIISLLIKLVIAYLISINLSLSQNLIFKGIQAFALSLSFSRLLSDSILIYLVNKK